MTSQELQQKLNDAQERVEKRKGTISKVCKKLGIAEKDVYDAYYSGISSNTLSYLPSKTAESIVAKIVQKKPERDENGNWNDESYEFNDKVSQLEDNLQKLYDLERIATKWKEDYNKQYNKENAEKIPSIWNFLCEWEKKAISWYLENAKKYFELEKNYDRELKKYYASEEFERSYNNYINSSYQMKYYRTPENVKRVLGDQFKSRYYADIDAFTKNITSIKHSYYYPNPDNRYEYYYKPVSYTVNEEYLNKTIAHEKLNKYYDLCNRITAEVGEIIDASGLSIGNQKGELNGIVKGTEGSARVETISAGGYNIQCFHYRVLVHKIR